MANFLDNLKQKIMKELSPKKILIIDNSYLHKGHKSFDEKKFHLKLIIESDKLRKINIIESNRIIHKLLKYELKSRIHSIQIEIK